MTLNKWVEQEDLNIEQFARQFAEVVAEDYGSHNFDCVRGVIEEKMQQAEHEHALLFAS